MKARAKHIRSTRRPLPAKGSEAFVVPSHGRLARRGCTEIVEDDREERGDWKGSSGISR
jgi:hypothetical protein